MPADVGILNNEGHGGSMRKQAKGGKSAAAHAAAAHATATATASLSVRRHYRFM